MSAGKINEFVGDQGFNQLDELLKKLGITRQALVDATAEATKFNNAIAGANSIPEFIEKQGKASTAIDKVTKAQENSRLAEIKLQQAREKSFDDYEKKLAKQEALEAKRHTTIISNSQAEVNAYEKSKRGQEGITTTVNKRNLAEAKAANEATERSAKVLAQQQTQAKEYVRAQGLIEKLQEKLVVYKTIQTETSNPATLQLYNKKIQDTEVLIKQLSNAGKDGFDSLGNAVKNSGNMFQSIGQKVVTLARLLPGIGVVGLIAFATGPIIEYITQLDVFNNRVDALAASTKAYKAAFEATDYKGAVSNVIDLNEQIKLSRQGFIDGEIVVEKYNSTMGQTVGKVSTLEEVERKLSENSKDYIKSMFFKAAAAAALSQGTDDLVDATKRLMTAQANLTLSATDLKQIKAQIAKGGDNAEMYKGLLKMAENAKKVDEQSVKDKKTTQDKLVNQTSNIYDKLSVMAQQFADKFNGGGKQQDIDKRRQDNFTESQKILLQKQIDTNLAIVENDKKSYSERQKALSTATAQQIQLRSLSLNQELNDVTLQADQKEVITQRYNADIEKTNLDAVKKSRDLKTQQNKDELALDNQRLENSKKTAENKTLDPNSDYEGRLNALNDYENASRKIITNSEKIAISDAGNNNIKVKTAKEKASNDLLEVDNDVAKKRLQITKEVQAALVKEFESGIKSLELNLQQEIIDLKDAQDTKLLAIDQYKSEALKGVADQYRDGKISASEYNQQVYDIDAQSAKDRVDLQISTIQKIIDARKEDLQFGIGSAKELQKAQDDLTKLQIQSSDLATKVEIDNINKLQEAKKNLAQLEKELVGAGIDLIKTLVDSAYQNQLNALQAQSKLVQENGNAEKAQINNSILSSKEKARQSAIVDAQTSNNQKSIADQEAKIKAEQAKFDKAASVAKIISATAVAEIQALTYLSNPFTAPLYPAIAATIAALGAVQLATVLATPLPKYEHGGTVKKDGQIITGEAGPELRIDPSGKYSLTAGHENVTYAKAGTKIISNKELVSMLGKPEAIHFVSNGTNDNRKIEKLLAENNDLLKKQKRPIVNVHTERWGAYSQNRNY